MAQQFGDKPELKAATEHKKKIRAELEAKVRKLRTEGLTFRTIAERTGLSAYVVAFICKKEV